VAFGAGRWPAPRLLTCLVVANSGLAGKAAVVIHFCSFSVCISNNCFTAESAGNQKFGCNAVQDTLLQAIASTNEKVSVGCKKVRLVVQLKADSRVIWSSSQKDVAAASRSCVQASAAQAQAQAQKQHSSCLEPGLPDISELRSNLQQEWHPDNNGVLGNIKVKPHSGRRVLWSCPNCPAGCPHIWGTTVYSRTRGTKCPYCEGRAVCQHKSLATKAPGQVKWNEEKNTNTPEQTLAGSRLRAEWKCPICSHEWQARIGSRVEWDRGCPCCSIAVAVRTKQPTFEAAQHALLLEWDYERNAVNGIHPHSTTLGSSKRVHWVCQKCPKGQLHRDQMPPCERTFRRFAGCPYCASMQTCTCNSLETHYPMISQEWDFAKKDLTPAQVTSRSTQVVWWANAVRGSWAQRIDERTDPRLNPR